MRHQLQKLKTKSSTKAERRFSERLKQMRVKFRTKVKINGREVDFIVNNYAVLINGHHPDDSVNKMLVEAGYTPVHISNNFVDKVNLYFIQNVQQSDKLS